MKVLLFCRIGVFSLTPDYGLRFILNCRKPGFHPHPKEPPSSIRALVSGSSALSSSPGRGTLHGGLGEDYSDSSSFYPVVEMVTGELKAGDNPTMD